MERAQREPDFDPLADDFAADPHPVWARLREQSPVARGARWDFWALTRYADVCAASTRFRTFSSEQGVVVPRNPVSGRRAPLHFDPPEHPRYRRPLNAVLGPERVAALEERFRAFAVELVDGFVGRGGGEFVGEVSSPYAGLVFAQFIGLPVDRARKLNAHSERFERAQSRLDAAAAEEENRYLYDFCRGLVAERRAAPLDPATDVVSALLALRIDGTPLDDEFVAGSVRQLLIAGHVAPTALIASAVLHLAEEPSLQASLRAEPELVPSAVEEFLRLHTPNQGFARTATTDAEIGGQPIGSGDQVALVLTAANRDPRVFDAPDELRLDRDPRLHVAFGRGPHKCPGATAARSEIRILLEELLARARWIERAGDVVPVPWPLHGPERLPLRCEAAR